ncbi:hypothetical protein AWB95_15775 [Mycobacterium celatum]|uniref:Uncharacterized protein n=1 Tax=Mycobacterium celatum TaxID=28045 RepID=A0A1X1RNN4_MYCCE|nr:hypothetical protein AWB95_15775 [Mycobacterium celatum]PIB78950.1 hypothetical protein CQY23_11015 [Mycobacterium celatum]
MIKDIEFSWKKKWGYPTLHTATDEFGDYGRRSPRREPALRGVSDHRPSTHDGTALTDQRRAMQKWVKRSRPE